MVGDLGRWGFVIVIYDTGCLFSFGILVCTPLVPALGRRRVRNSPSLSLIEQ